MTPDNIFTLARPDRGTGSSSGRDVIEPSVAPSGDYRSALIGIKEELKSHPPSTSIFLITPLLVLSTPDIFLLWKRNNYTRSTPYIMPNQFKNKISVRQPSWSAHHQRRRLPERAHISVDYISTGAVFGTAEPQWNVDDPATFGDAVHGPHFTRGPVTVALTLVDISWNWPIAAQTWTPWTIFRSAPVMGGPEASLGPATVSCKC